MIDATSDRVKRQNAGERGSVVLRAMDAYKIIEDAEESFFCYR